MKQIITALLFLVALPSLSQATETDTIFVPVHVTDTIYLVSPPDTVFIQEETAPVYDTPSAPDNEYIMDIDMDTIAPAINFYIGYPIFLNIFSAWWGTVFLDFLVEMENEHRGSIVFSWSSVMQLWNAEYGNDSDWWEGFRSSMAMGFGYRHYLITSTRTLRNTLKKKVIHRNVPLNSISIYVQGLAAPTFKYAYEHHLGDGTPKKSDLTIGVSGEASTGLVWNGKNTLINFGFAFGYQYWPKDGRKFLSFDIKDSDVEYNIVNGSSPRGFYFKITTALGF